jgi:hypothetical protein
MPAARTATKKTTPAAKGKGKAAPATPAKAAPQEDPKVFGLTKTQRKALATKIAKLRKDGVKWDGDGGICDQCKIRTALVGRAILREFAHEDLIAPLTGTRAKS